MKDKRFMNYNWIKLFLLRCPKIKSIGYEKKGQPITTLKLTGMDRTSTVASKNINLKIGKTSWSFQTIIITMFIYLHIHTTNKRKKETGQMPEVKYHPKWMLNYELDQTLPLSIHWKMIEWKNKRKWKLKHFGMASSTQRLDWFFIRSNRMDWGQNSWRRL